jgi:RNA polymerase sigma-70 factor (ECF subfamily)
MRVDAAMSLEDAAAAAETEPERIARGLRRRDLALLDELVERYQARLARYLIHLLGTQDYVEDLLQETWLRVLERGRQFDSRFRFEPWLFAIARHLAIDLRRTRNLAGFAAGGEERDAPLADRPSAEASPFEAAARTQDAALLASSLDALASIYREALLLRFHEELSLRETATIVRAPVTTVSSRIHRGLAALRARLEEGESAHGRS